MVFTEQIPISTTALHGLLICIPFTLFVAISFSSNPRLWLHSLPVDIRQMAAPKTNREIRITKFVLLPLYSLVLPGLSVSSVLYVSSHLHLDLSFFDILVHLYGIWIAVHLWDLLVIDTTYMILINPQRLSGIFVVPVSGLLAALL